MRFMGQYYTVVRHHRRHREPGSILRKEGSSTGQKAIGIPVDELGRDEVNEGRIA